MNMAVRIFLSVDNEILRELYFHNPENMIMCCVLYFIPLFFTYFYFNASVISKQMRNRS